MKSKFRESLKSQILTPALNRCLCTVKANTHLSPDNCYFPLGLINGQEEKGMTENVTKTKSIFFQSSLSLLSK